jgi:hypothetical protein
MVRGRIQPKSATSFVNHESLRLVWGSQALIDAHFRTLAKGKKDGVVTAAEAVQP